jgi:hypothetical protein
VPKIIDKSAGLLEMNQQGFEQQYLSGAPIGAEGFAGLQSFQRGETPAYAIPSPAGQRAAREQFAATGDPAVQMRQRQATLDGVARANTPNAGMQGMTPNAWIASKAGTAKPNPYRHEYKDTLDYLRNESPEEFAESQTAFSGHTERELNDPDLKADNNIWRQAIATVKRERAKERAMAHIAERRAALAKSKGQNPAGIQYNAMIQASGYKENQKFMLDQQKQAEKDNAPPTIGALKSVLPPGKEYDLTNDEEFDKWFAAANERYGKIKSGQPAYTAPPPPPTFQGNMDAAKRGWGSLGSQGSGNQVPVDPKWEAQVQSAMKQGDVKKRRDSLISYGYSEDEAEAMIDPSDEDLQFTADQLGISVAEVKKRMGLTNAD